MNTTTQTQETIDKEVAFDMAWNALDLNWKMRLDRVETVPNAHYLDPIQAEGFKAIVREDTNDIFGIVSDRYTLVQNSTLKSAIKMMLGEMGATLHKVYQIDGGRVVKIVSKLDKNMTLLKDDVITPYFAVYTRNDGEGSVFFTLEALRLICSNGMTGITPINRLKIRHAGKVVIDTDHFKHHFRKQKTELEKLTQLVADASETKSSPNGFSYYKDVFGWKDDLKDLSTRSQNIYHELENLAFFSPGVTSNQHMSRSLWDLYNSLTYWVDHVRNNRKSSNEVGSGKALKDKAFQVMKDRIITL